MEIRQIDYIEDLDQVIKLLQENLEPNFSPKLFKWKHMENPFGRSFGVVASENDEIVGVRMGLYWQFLNHHLDNEIKSIRPVDTVVKKGYRKKGIFTKMNVFFMEILENIEVDIIFNTPNRRSLPANLKMGWKVLENLNHYKLGIIQPFSRVINFNNISASKIFWKPSLSGDIYYHTNYKGNFLKWRYEGMKYRVASFNKENSNCIIYSTTQIKNLKTIIVYEIFGDEIFYSTMINSLGKANSIYFIYFKNNTNWKNVKFLFSLIRKKPNILFKDDRFSIRENIKFSAGDLEAII